MLHGHVRSAVASGQARRVGNLSAAQRMNVSIVLQPRDQDGLINLLRQLYDPNSPEYHKFLSVGQFTDQFAPSAKDYQAIVDFAAAPRPDGQQHACQSPGGAGHRKCRRN